MSLYRNLMDLERSREGKKSHRKGTFPFSITKGTLRWKGSCIVLPIGYSFPSCGRQIHIVKKKNKNMERLDADVIKDGGLIRRHPDIATSIFSFLYNIPHMDLYSSLYSKIIRRHLLI
ncbi:hypothetical protein TNCT_677871 [Trichonephila clavata]|uniref:Uncharacterized protein n=1 Tax=Trichonephila clavata TaxID=2740835 RepID=A0A8X6H0Q6_TRICU|nr:hypothetical protein TNCT_677871 [Trichonephila clavata]